MSDIFYTKTHEWLRDEGDTAVVGITDHAQQLLGDMVFVELPEVGDTFAAGDELGVVESVKAASDFYAPIDGEVVEVNAAVSESPEVVNSEPLDGGWLVKMRPVNGASREHLLSEAQYQAEIED